MSPRHPMPKWLAQLLTVLGTLVVCLMVLEVGLRALGQQPTHNTDALYVIHGRSYRMGKLLSVVTRAAAYAYTIYTNDYGFRDQCACTHDVEGKQYALFLGTSQTFGNGVDYQDSFVGIIAKGLQEAGIDSLNLAIGGHHLGEQVELLRDFASAVVTKPAIVFICVDPLMISKFDIEHPGLIAKGGYLFEGHRWFLPYLRVMLANSSAAYCFFRDGIRLVQVRYGIGNETRDARDFYLDLYSDENRIRSPKAQADLFRMLDGFVGYLRSFQARPVFIFLPTVAGLTIAETAQRADRNPSLFDPLFYDKLVEAYCRDRGILCINPHSLLLRAQKAGQQLSFIRDGHYNKATNRMVANYILDALRLAAERSEQQSNP